MPLDFCLWDQIETRSLAKKANENEDIASYKKRLHLTAKRLPKSLIKNCLNKMKENILMTKKNRGDHTKLD